VNMKMDKYLNNKSRPSNLGIVLYLSTTMKVLK